MSKEKPIYFPFLLTAAAGGGKLAAGEGTQVEKRTTTRAAVIIGVLAAAAFLAEGCPSSQTACEQLSEKVVICMSNACSELTCNFCNICVTQTDETQCAVYLGLDGGAPPLVCDEPSAQAALKNFICDPYDKVVAQTCSAEQN
jgi:hypothetical protein